MVRALALGCPDPEARGLGLLSLGAQGFCGARTLPNTAAKEVWDRKVLVDCKVLYHLGQEGGEQLGSLLWLQGFAAT